MAEISLEQGKHPRIEPLDKVEITWSDGINLRRLRNLLIEGINTLSPNEQKIWNTVKDKEDWLYCFIGHIDDNSTIVEFYPKEKQDDVRNICGFLRNLHSRRVTYGTDVRLDFGKVEDQTIETRIGQHFNDGDYLEYYRKNAVIRFPLAIKPYNNVDYKGDYIDALETILIKGNKRGTYFRIGVCNKKKIEDPQLLYPINSVVNIVYEPAIEKDIIVKINKN